MNFNLSELEILFYSIKSIVDYMINANYNDRRFKIYLSNGEHLTFSVNNNTIAHLLGVNTTYLTSTGIFKSTNSFDLLNELIESPLKIHKLNKDGIIDYNKLFSKHIMNKVSGFIENIKLNINEMEFVCKYDKERTYGVNEISECYDYIIVQKLSNDKIGVLCLVRNNGYYAPMSNQIYDNYDNFAQKFKDIIKFQEITLMSGIDVYNISDDYSKNIYLNLEDKGHKINKLKLYKNEFNCSIDVASDFSYAINKMKQNYENSSNSNNSLNYSEIITELKAFREKTIKLEQENNELKNNYEALVEENNRLSSENSKLNKTQEEIYQIIKKAR